MPYAILRFQKRKAGGVAACERHNERKKEAYKSNPDIDMERSKDNYHLVNPPRYTYKKEINRMVAEAGCRTRKDSVMMVETLITASPEFMNSLPPKEQKAYFTMALDFISERVGEKNILSAVVHMDERTPHMHLCFVPITPDNKLSAKTILGNQKSLSEWQTAYHERMSSRWNQLERGQSSMETKRKHVPTWLYKLGGRLDKQYEEIVSALSDINAFNAGKKRDKALELIAAWLPDVEKFSKEISKQSAYINSLKEQIGQESDYAGRMRDEKYEQELKVQKANQKIFELQRTNEQMGRLLSKIPPEVLEELQKNHKSRAKEILATQRFTQCPPRYTEASLVRKLEELGCTCHLDTASLRSFLRLSLRYSLMMSPSSIVKRWASVLICCATSISFLHSSRNGSIFDTASTFPAKFETLF